MKNNFHELYKTYSTIELLKIVKRPGDYQAEAIDAANDILKNRNVSDKDFLQVEKFYEELKPELPFIQKIFNQYNDYFFSSLPAIHQLGNINIVPLLISLSFIYSAFVSIQTIFYYLQKNDYFFFSTYLFILLFIPFLYYLFYKKSKWFWILVFLDAVLGIFSAIKTLLSYVYYLYIYISESNPIFPINDGNHSISNFIEMLVFLILNIATIYYFSRKEITIYYKISELIKNRVLLISLIIIILSTITSFYSLYLSYKSFY